MISASMRRRARSRARVLGAAADVWWLRSWGSSWLSYRSIVLGRDGSLGRGARTAKHVDDGPLAAARLVDREGRVPSGCLRCRTRSAPSRRAGRSHAPPQPVSPAASYRRCAAAISVAAASYANGACSSIGARKRVWYCVSNALPPGIRSSGRPGSSAVTPSPSLPASDRKVWLTEAARAEQRRVHAELAHPARDRRGLRIEGRRRTRDPRACPPIAVSTPLKSVVLSFTYWRSTIAPPFASTPLMNWSAASRATCDRRSPRCASPSASSPHTRR